MGAGRSFVLLAALAAALPAAAEPAPAVSPYAALAQGSGVELRDAYNRPISRDSLSRGLEAGAKAEAASAATKVGRALADFLARLAAPAHALRQEPVPGEGHGELAAAAPREPKARFVPVSFARPDALAPARRAAAAGSAPATLFGRAFNLPLRI